MPTVTSPYVETKQVVTGIIYQLSIAEDTGGPGITRLDIGPCHFAGIPPKVKYPEAVTNELCPAGWKAIRWVTEPDGKSWLRWDGGILRPEDGNILFQMTSNYPAATSDAELWVWRGKSSEPQRFQISAPDYTLTPPKINNRHDVIGQGTIFQTGSGCAPPAMALLFGTILAVLRHIIG